MTDKKKALNRMMASCARRETCTHDARQKLMKMDVPIVDVENILTELKKGRFIDDERFPRAFVREKLEIYHWGQQKIRYALRMKEITDELISRILHESDTVSYQEMLDDLLKKKLRQISPEEDPYKMKARLIRFAASRGFEADLIYQRVDKLLFSKKN